MAYKLDLDGHKFYLAGNSVAYEFDRATNQRTDKVIGTRFDVVDLNNGYEHLNVLVEGAPNLLFDPEEPIPTDTEIFLVGLEARPYVARNGRIAVTASAQACRLASDATASDNKRPGVEGK